MDVDQVTFYIEGAEIRPIIKMPTSATILQLKEEIKEHTNVPVARQILSCYETTLMDCHTIKHYNFGPLAGIQLAIETDTNQMDANVTVTCPAFRISLKVNQMDTVIKLKQKIGEMWGIQTEDVTLWHLSRRMQDHLPLRSYYIIDGSDVEFTRTGHDS